MGLCYTTGLMPKTLFATWASCAWGGIAGLISAYMFPLIFKDDRRRLVSAAVMGRYFVCLLPIAFLVQRLSRKEEGREGREGPI